ELYEVAMLLRQRARPRGNRAASLAISGGNLVLFTDLAASQGISFPSFAAETAARLRMLIPGFMAVNNPADLSAGAIGTKDLFATAARTLLEDPSVDVTVPLITFAPAADIRAVAAMAETAEKPVAILWTGRCSDDPSLTPRALVSEGHAVYRDALPCAQAVSRTMRWAEFLRRRADAPAPQRPADSDPARARALLEGVGGSLSEGASRQVLACYGLHGPSEVLAATPEAAVAAAAGFGGAVVLKIQSPDIPHKTEAGVIRLGVGGEAVAPSAREILDAAKAYAPDARIEGILVQEMVTGGQEMLLGMARDLTFGPVLTLGFGGIHVEVLRDVTFRLPPVSAGEAQEMLEELRLAPLLRGVRGAPASDMPALADAIARFSWLAADLGELLEEVDMNPLAVLPAGGGVRVLDALVVPRRSGA
ncbi:MAG TPA: acetate--CoA ligase family protein, partial [Roseomonas sp.]